MRPELPAAEGGQAEKAGVALGRQQLHAPQAGVFEACRADSQWLNARRKALPVVPCRHADSAAYARR